MCEYYFGFVLNKSNFIGSHFNKRSLLPGHSDALKCPEQNANVWSAVVTEYLARHFGINSDLAGAKKMASISFLCEKVKLFWDFPSLQLPEMHPQTAFTSLKWNGVLIIFWEECTSVIYYLGPSQELWSFLSLHKPGLSLYQAVTCRSEFTVYLN